MIYTVKLSDGEVIEIVADNEQQAMEIAQRFETEQKGIPPESKLSVATPGSRAALEKEKFDFEKGVALPGLRAALGFAEKWEEKTEYLTNKVGSEGWTDYEGSLALTPLGLERLGITPEDNRNVVIDESGMSWGDVADLSGIAGPIAGTLVTMNPWGRGVKYGYGLLKEMGLMGAGAGLGKGGEELVEAAVGYQKQTPGEIAATVGEEAAFMAVAQGVFGLAARGVKALIGPKASVETLDAINNMAKGLPDPKLVMAKEAELGRALTAKELARIPKVKAIPHQSALGRPIPGRMQSAYETILQPTRRHEANIQYGFARLEQIMKELGATDVSIAKFSNKLESGTLIAKDIEQAGKELTLAGNNAEGVFQQYLVNIIHGIDKGLIDTLPKTRFQPISTEQGAKQIEAMLRGNDQAKSLFALAFSKRYRQLEDEYGQIHTQLGLGKVFDANGKPLTQPNKFGVVNSNLVRAEEERLGRKLTTEELKNPKFKQEEVYFNSMDEVVAHYEQIAAQTGKEMPAWVRAYKEGAEVPLVQDAAGNMIRDPSAAAAAEIDPFLREGAKGFGEYAQVAMIPTGPLKARAQKLSEDVIKGGPASELGGNMIVPINDLNSILTIPDFITLRQWMTMRQTLRTGKPSELLPGGLDSYWSKELFSEAEMIMTAMSETGTFQAAMLKNLPEFLQKKFTPEVMAKTLGQYQQLNARYAKFLNSFDDLTRKKLERGVKQGGYDRDELMAFMLKKNQPQRYQELMNILPEAEKAELTQALRRHWLTLSLKSSYSGRTNRIDPFEFKKQIDKLGTTAEAVLGPYYTPMAEALQTIERYGEKLTVEEAAELVRVWTKSYPKADGIPDSLRILEGIADAAEETAKFGRSRLVKAVQSPRFEPEQVVDIIFKPQSGNLIREAKELLRPETFTMVRENAMRTLVNKGVGPGDTVQSIFNTDALQKAIASYGDDTLEAMFGREIVDSLKGFGREMSIITGVEGQGAGNIVAGAVALYAFNLANITTIGTIGIIGRMLSSNRVVQALSKTDSGSIRVVMNAMRRAIQLEIAHLIATGQQAAADELQAAIDRVDVPMDLQEDVSNEAGNILEQVKEAVTPIRNTIRQTIGETFGAAEVSPISSAAPTTSPIPLPNVAPPQIGIANPIVLPNPQDRFLAERLGRV